MRIPLPKLRELAEAVRAVVKGPFTTKFPAKVDSVHPSFRGIIKFNKDKCICCGACVRVCPTNAREMVVDLEKGVMRNIHHAERCIYCGQCVLYCTTREGIKHTPEFDLSRTERSDDWETSVEHELAYCEVCGEPFATKAHLLWISHKVGDLVSANPTLFLTMYEHLGTSAPSLPRGPSAPYRSDIMRVLCPECRRKAYLTEEWGY
jgi:hydrogenase-4 component H